MIGRSPVKCVALAGALGLRARPGIEKDGPLDHLAGYQDATGRPWIVAQQGRDFIRIARIHDEKSTTVVGVWTCHDDTTLRVQTVDKSGVFVPKRLLARRYAGDPARTLIAKHE